MLPEVRAAQAAQQLSGALAEGKRYLEAADLPRAKAAFEKVLALDPDNAEATAGLKQLEAEQKLADLYQQGVSAQEAGKTQVALQMYSDLLLQRSGYRDVAVRVAAIKQRATEDALFSRAETEYQAGRHAEAIQAYQQLQALNASYQRDTVAGRLFDSYMQLGRAIVAERPVALVELPQAREYFRQAAALKPRDTDAASQERLITVYLAGQAAYEARNWDEAARWYEAVFGQQKGYLDNIYVPQLYEAYIASGDSHAAAERWADAWNQYTKAIALPVPNKVLAEQRRAAVAFRITPTPTPTATPTATPLPTATAYIYVPPTALPSATPAAPLTTYRNQIVFKADKDGQSGFWVMNPDGSNRRYLGAFRHAAEAVRRPDQEGATFAGRPVPGLHDAGGGGQVPADLHPVPGQPAGRGVDAPAHLSGRHDLRSGVGARRQPHRLREPGKGQRRPVRRQPGRHQYLELYAQHTGNGTSTRPSRPTAGRSSSGRTARGRSRST